MYTTHNNAAILQNARAMNANKVNLMPTGTEDGHYVFLMKGESMSQNVSSGKLYVGGGMSTSQSKWTETENSHTRTVLCAC